jgi:hypothetical protein
MRTTNEPAELSATVSRDRHIKGEGSGRRRGGGGFPDADSVLRWDYATTDLVGELHDALSEREQVLARGNSITHICDRITHMCDKITHICDEITPKLTAFYGGTTDLVGELHDELSEREQVLGAIGLRTYPIRLRQS